MVTDNLLLRARTKLLFIVIQNCTDTCIDAFSFHVAETPRSLVLDTFRYFRLAPFLQICPEMQVNEIHALYDKHHKVSSFVESHQNTHNSVKYEVI